MTPRHCWQHPNLPFESLPVQLLIKASKHQSLTVPYI
ncbi:unnamed protein product [Brassica rapa subsp. narinosa]